MCLISTRCAGKSAEPAGQSVGTSQFPKHTASRNSQYTALLAGFQAQARHRMHVMMVHAANRRPNKGFTAREAARGHWRWLPLLFLLLLLLLLLLMLLLLILLLLLLLLLPCTQGKAAGSRRWGTHRSLAPGQTGRS